LVLDLDLLATEAQWVRRQQIVLMPGALSAADYRRDLRAVETDIREYMVV